MISRAQPHAATTMLTALLLLAAGASADAQTLKYPLGILGKYTTDGMLVQRVETGSPMDRVGVQPGDVILKIDGQLIQNQDDLAAVLNTSGGTILLTLRKNDSGRTVRLSADLTGKGKGIQAPYFLGVIGKYTRDGMLLSTIIPGTPAARLGLQSGDLILKINNQFIGNQADLCTVLNSSGGSATLVVRSGRTGRVGSLDVDLTTYQLGCLGDFTRDGLLIATVAPATPAERSGLQPGDLIARVDNQVVRTQKDFNALINNSGGTVTLLVRKAADGLPVRLFVDLMNNPLGAWCEPGADGMRLTAVAADTPAAALGLNRGDVLLKVDDQRVRTQNDLIAALNNSGGLVTLSVRKADTGRVIRLEADLAR
jgi:S1-C subfamily serine protease